MRGRFGGEGEGAHAEGGLWREAGRPIGWIWKILLSPLFQLHLGPNLRTSYIRMMHQTYTEISERLKAENERLPKSSRIPLRIGGKLFTPKRGTFLVQLVPEDPMANVLTLLFRFKDLYFESYHCHGVWYRLSDFSADLPPQEQIPYNKVVILGISSSYKDIGGCPKLGRPTFEKCYMILAATAELLTTKSGLMSLQSGPLSVPAVGISEAIRFRILEKWVKGVLRGFVDVKIPDIIYQYFTEWGDLSTSMYLKVPPQDFVLNMVDICSRMGVLKRRNMAEVLKSGHGDENPPAVVFGWHNDDNKRLLRASISIHKMQETISCYQNCFGMKLLRREDAAEGQQEAVMGFEPETRSFVLHMMPGQQAEKYDPGNAFGHFSIAHENVDDLVENIRCKGGAVKRDPRPDKKENAISAIALDPCNYKFKLLQRGPTPERICQISLHVGNIDSTISFYEKALGMSLLTRNDKLQYKHSFARMGYKDEEKTTVLEFNCKHGVKRVNNKKGYKKVTIGTNDVRRTAEAVKLAIKYYGGSILEEPSMMPVVRVPFMTFVDSDGWTVVVVEKNDFLKERP